MERAFLLRGCEETQPGRDLAEDILSYAKRMEPFAKDHGVTIKGRYDPNVDGGVIEIRCEEEGNGVASSAVMISIMSAAMILGARRTLDDDWKEIMADAWQTIADNAEDASKVMADMAGMQIELADRLRVREAQAMPEMPAPEQTAKESPRA